MTSDPGGRAAGSPFAAWQRTAAAGLTLRPLEDADLPFLERLYGSTRAAELTRTAWPESERAAFVAMQFRAQHAHYQRHYPEADWLVVVHEGVPVGRLYLERWPSQHRVIDIIVGPAYRGRGFGTALLRDLADEAAGLGRGISIHVEKANPAMRLYLRLGFVREADRDVYDLMRWTPPGREPQLNTA